ncbi:MAG: hypothetical protein JO316_01205 [Abitibacteriaceae bacterium]|nr:hypothetical protein [Abditibacteriaceae bacterium]MBV9863947.1 hypothetical protein [Abditibacteriaceae bacterium]
MDTRQDENKAAESTAPGPTAVGPTPEQTTKLRYEIFTDPLYGSERYIEFEPHWVAESRDGIFRAVPWILRSRHYDVTYINFKNDRRYIVWGHHTAEIKARQQEQDQNREPPMNTDGHG